MGYDGHRKGVKKSQVLARYLNKTVWFSDGSKKPAGHWSNEVVKHKSTTDGEWCIWETCHNGDVVERYLGIILFQRLKGDSECDWLTKVVIEAEEPYYYNVPQSYLKEKVTKKNDKWRKEVAKVQAEESRHKLRWKKVRDMVKAGDTIYFAENITETVGTFVSFWKKSLTVDINGKTYRCGAKHVDVDKTLHGLRRNV